MDEKLARRIFFIVLGIIAVLAVISLLSTLVQMIVPLAIVAVGAFAFYKFVIEGRDTKEAMEDEVAESSGVIVQSTAEPITQTEETTSPEPEIQAEETPEERLSAVDQAKRDYIESVTPAEEILDQIKARKQRLQGDED